jgi:hypothetical protein
MKAKWLSTACRDKKCPSGHLKLFAERVGLAALIPGGGIQQKKCRRRKRLSFFISSFLMQAKMLATEFRNKKCPSGAFCFVAERVGLAALIPGGGVLQ